MITSKIPAVIFSPLAEEVLEGLSASPKRLPPKLFYDSRGSRLFEQITELPEYYLTRTERAIFQEYAGEIVQQAGSNLTLIELGAGSASKTRILVEALARRQLQVGFYPVDVSRSALKAAVSSLNGHIRNLRVKPIVADYSKHLPLLNVPGCKLVLFIGSTIGNFAAEEAQQFLVRLRSSLQKGDALLLGFDMAKRANLLHAAYNDAQGVTAEFNKNVLLRINRELGGHFDPDTFQHVAFWNPKMSRIEMHLESRLEQKVWIRDLAMGFDFAEGERIHTENSYKFTSASIAAMVRSAGFRLEKTWTDAKRWFSVVLARV
ncbi:MAG TPA: L-histidine N(alpha)-methyltransferase [Candidatus Angelobacter sp.]|nr:L-histidine N(alpha)-methyltransferase [Candidatus Angelobacter sp.]